MSKKIGLHGNAKVLKAFDKLKDVLIESEMIAIFEEQGEVVKKKVEQNIRTRTNQKSEDQARVMHGPLVARKKAKKGLPKTKTKHLIDAVVAKPFKNQDINNPASFVGMDAKKAPHFHLVELGTIVAAGVFYFKDAVSSTRSKVKKNIARDVKILLEKTAKKNELGTSN